MGHRASRGDTTVFVHEAFFYSGDDEFVAGSVPFVRDCLSRREHAVVAVLPRKVDLLRSALDHDADRVTFIDMEDCGRNPARIIQMWRDLVDAAELRGSAVCGIGEPIWSGRTREEVLEAELHEALLNEAFDGDRHLMLRCPYDVSALDPDVVSTACVTHPELVSDQRRALSGSYAPTAVVAGAFADPLPEPPFVEDDVVYAAGDLQGLREVVRDLALAHALDAETTDALVLSVREIAGNSLRHGGGSGRLRSWTAGSSLVCELSDRGHIRESMVGRVRPRPDLESGRGVWLANQLCDLVQIRSSSAGTAVRLHVRCTRERPPAQTA